MKRIVVVGMGLVVAVIVSATFVAAAAAELPEFMHCHFVPKSSGAFENLGCGVESPTHTGHYELLPGSGEGPFTSTAGKATLESPEVPEPLRCKTTSLTGEVSGSKGERNVIVTLGGCEALHAVCTTPGQEAGTVVTNRLSGELGYLAGKGTSTPKVGVLLSEQETTYAAEFSCEGLQVRVHGPLIAEITGDINADSSKPTYHFQQSGGVPEYTSFEGGTFLEDAWRWEFNTGSGFAPAGGSVAGLQLSAPVVGEKLEIKA
jgi:hypothetical protein